MASIHQRPDGRFHISFRLGGTQFKPSLKTTNQAQAARTKASVEETLHLIETGRILLPDNATRAEVVQFLLSGGRHVAKPSVSVQAPFKTVVEEYFAAYTAGKEASTIAGERIHTGHLLRIIGNTKPFAAINVDALQQYAAQRCREKGQRNRQLSAETVKKEFRTFAQVWAMARAKGYVNGPTPSRQVKLDLPDEKEPFRNWEEIETIIRHGNLTLDEQRDLWDGLFLDEKRVLEFLGHVEVTAEHPYIYAAIAFAAFTGARRSEIMRSRVEDWVFNRGIVRIREKKGSRKSRTTFREVNIHPRLAAIMKEWFSVHPGGVYTIVVPPNLARTRVKQNHPEPLTPNRAKDCFRRVVAGSKWEVLRGWHVLRHSFCSNCARQGIPDLVIDRWMGHKGDEAIKNRYRHLFATDQEQFMSRLFAAADSQKAERDQLLRAADG